VWAYDEWGGCKYYDSISEASKDLEVPASSINKCCQGVYRTAYGYSFEYYESDKEIDNLGEFRKHGVKDYRRKRVIDTSSEPIVAVDIRSGEYSIYDNFSYMCRALCIDERNAYRVLRHERYYNSIGGYSLWRYSEVDFSVLSSQKISHHVKVSCHA
jgi:hypothetical protein